MLSTVGVYSSLWQPQWINGTELVGGLSINHLVLNIENDSLDIRRLGRRRGSGRHSMKITKWRLRSDGKKALKRLKLNRRRRKNNHPTGRQLTTVISRLRRPLDHHGDLASSPAQKKSTSLALTTPRNHPIDSPGENVVTKPSTAPPPDVRRSFRIFPATKTANDAVRALNNLNVALANKSLSEKKKYIQCVFSGVAEPKQLF